MSKLHRIAAQHGFKSNEEFYAKYPTQEDYIREHGQPSMKEGGDIAFPQQPNQGQFFDPGWVPPIPDYFYAMGGALPGGANEIPCFECGGMMEVGGTPNFSNPQQFQDYYKKQGYQADPRSTNPHATPTYYNPKQYSFDKTSNKFSAIPGQGGNIDEHGNPLASHFAEYKAPVQQPKQFVNKPYVDTSSNPYRAQEFGTNGPTSYLDTRTNKVVSAQQVQQERMGQQQQTQQPMMASNTEMEFGGELDKAQQGQQNNRSRNSASRPNETINPNPLLPKGVGMEQIGAWNNFQNYLSSQEYNKNSLVNNTDVNRLSHEDLKKHTQDLITKYNSTLEDKHSKLPAEIRKKISLGEYLKNNTITPQHIADIQDFYKDQVKKDTLIGSETSQLRYPQIRSEKHDYDKSYLKKYADKFQGTHLGAVSTTDRSGQETTGRYVGNITYDKNGKQHIDYSTIKEYNPNRDISHLWYGITPADSIQQSNAYKILGYDLTPPPPPPPGIFAQDKDQDEHAFGGEIDDNYMQRGGQKKHNKGYEYGENGKFRRGTTWNKIVRDHWDRHPSRIPHKKHIEHLAKLRSVKEGGPIAPSANQGETDNGTSQNEFISKYTNNFLQGIRKNMWKHTADEVSKEFTPYEEIPQAQYGSNFMQNGGGINMSSSYGFDPNMNNQQMYRDRMDELNTGAKQSLQQFGNAAQQFAGSAQTTYKQQGGQQKNQHSLSDEDWKRWQYIQDIQKRYMQGHQFIPTRGSNNYIPMNSTTGYNVSNAQLSRLSQDPHAKLAGFQANYGPIARLLGSAGRNMFGPKSIHYDFMVDKGHDPKQDLHVNPQVAQQRYVQSQYNQQPQQSQPGVTGVMQHSPEDYLPSNLWQQKPYHDMGPENQDQGEQFSQVSPGISTMVSEPGQNRYGGLHKFLTRADIGLGVPANVQTDQANNWSGQMNYFNQNPTQASNISVQQNGLTYSNNNGPNPMNAPIDRNDNGQQKVGVDLKRHTSFDPEAVANFSIAGINAASGILEQGQAAKFKKQMMQKQDADNNFGVMQGGNRGTYGRTGSYNGVFNPSAMNAPTYTEHNFGSINGPSIGAAYGGQYNFGGKQEYFQENSYQEGGEYEMNDEQLKQFLAAGGQIEYLD